MVRVGEGIGDVAYFLATALAPMVLYQRYRAHLTYPFEAMIISQAIGGMMAPESNRILIQRVAAAVEDHDAFAVVVGA
jgi:hypothetical protein